MTTLEVKSLVCLVIGDPHFKTTNPIETEPMADKIVEIATNLKPDFIVDLGDTLDRHESIHVSPLERATQFLRHLAHIAPLYVIIGNHDRPNNSNYLTTEHPFNALKEWANTTVVDQVIVREISGMKFTFVPYVPPGRFKDALATVPGSQDQLRAIFAHQEFKGAKMGAIRSVDGDEWGLNEPVVISGHIHDYDQLQPNLIYTGTPIQHGFGDREDKTISIFRFPVLTAPVTDIKQTYSEERVDLKLPKKILVHLTCDQVLTYVPPADRGPVQMKIIIKGTSAEIKAVMKLAVIKQMKDAGIKVVYKDLPSQPPERSPPRHDKIREALTYSVRLYQAARQDQDLHALFVELFGEINHPSPVKLRMITPEATTTT